MKLGVLGIEQYQSASSAFHPEREITLRLHVHTSLSDVQIQLDSRR